jgi:hypothetical protein
MQLSLYHQTADGERRSSRPEIPITLYDPVSNVRTSLFSRVQGSYDLITEVFRKGMISTERPDYGLKQKLDMKPAARDPRNEKGGTAHAGIERFAGATWRFAGRYRRSGREW